MIDRRLGIIRPKPKKKFFNYDTPVETYEYKKLKKTVYVKRDDLFGRDPAPHLAKLRGIKKYVDKMDAKGVTVLGDMDTRVSKSGWGLACACVDTNIKPLVFYPKLKEQTELPPIQQKAKLLGAEIVPLQAMRTASMCYRAKKITEGKGGVMMPMGLTLRETVEEVAKVVKGMDKEYFEGDVVVCTGTGTICAGIIAGLMESNIKPNHLFGVSCGMSTGRQAKVIEGLLGEYFNSDAMDDVKIHRLPRYVQLIVPSMDYYDINTIETPFPCNSYYDKKAWWFLMNFMKGMKDKILFWNVGD